MFWTAFIWGLGVSCGGSIGAMSFVVLLYFWNLLVKSAQFRRANEFAELSYAALVRRNELTEKQIEQLEKMTVVIKDAADSMT
jgi:hypothetical protein